MSKRRKDEQTAEKPPEIGVIGDLTDHEADICEKLLEVPVGGECTLYFNSPGGGSYSAIAMLALLVLRDLRATGIVLGECSSAAIWPLAACRRRLVTPYSVLLFHPMRWQSEESVQLSEAREWARHFADLEQEMDKLLANFLGIPLDQVNQWMKPGRYVSGREFADAGLAELIDLPGKNR
jgi:ATP-dependent protease ClpP protease subunit